jgi:hypothetical protein
LKTPKWWLILLLPLWIGLFWGLAGRLDETRGQAYYVGLVDFDQSQRSEALFNALKEHPSLEVVQYKDRLSAMKGLSNKEVLQTYILLEGFEAKINEGLFDGVIEVASMIESPYSDWLNDQISLSVIREWLISDGYHRLVEFNPAYSRQLYEEAFEAYYSDHELLIFKEVYRDQQAIQGDGQDVPSYMTGFLSLWCFYLLVACLWLVRKFYLDRHSQLIDRLRLSGIGLSTYLSEYLLGVVALGIIGGLNSYLPLQIYVDNLFFSSLDLMGAVIVTGTLLVVFSYLISSLPVALNQLVLLCLVLFIGWGVLATPIIDLLPMGSYFKFISPVTIFFQFFV